MRPPAFLLFLLLLPGTLLAQEWREQVRLFEAALESGDYRARRRALAWLAGEDHAAAVPYLLRFGARDHLRALWNVRSLRELVDRLDDGDEAVADLAAATLARHERRHAVGDVLRSRLRQAIRKGEEKRALRCVRALDGSLDVTDAGRVRAILADEKCPEPVRQGLRDAYPEPADDAFGEQHAAYRKKVAEILSHPAMADLERLHESFVRLRFANAFRRDEYFRDGGQRRRWDKRTSPERIVAKAPTVDFAQPEVAALIEEAEAIRKLLSEFDDGRTIVGAPWHPEFFALNRGGARTIETIAFTPREREWQDRRDAVLAANEATPAVGDRERANADLVNHYRLGYDLLPLRLDADLVTCARNHARYQQALGAIAHEFRGMNEPFGRTPQARMIKAGYPPKYAGGENVLFGTPDPKAAFDWWRNSPGHRANMLAPYWTEIGVGEHGGFWTQNFGSEPYDEDHDAR